MLLLQKKRKEWKNGKQKMRIFGEKENCQLGLENFWFPCSIVRSCVRLLMSKYFYSWPFSRFT